MMEFIKYVSDDNWFTCDIPSYWTAFKEDDGTALFYDDDDWKGNLRITPLKFEGPDAKEQESKVQRSIQRDFDENIGAEKIMLGSKNSVSYLKKINQDGNDLINYWWVTGDGNILFLCTFTMDTSRKSEDVAIKELEFARQSLISLKAN
jgi:hypothetical protein